jgi:long-subunit acyl-CoA synthetase (AMP-forming)
LERTTLEKRAQKPGLRADTVAQAFTETVRGYPDRVALRTRGGEVEITWEEYGARVDRFGHGLRALGLERGDTFAIMLTNRPEFHIADTAALSLGATPFSLYQTLTPDQIAYQLTDSGAEIVITEPAFIERVLAARDNAPHVRHVVITDGEAAGTIAFDELLAGEGSSDEIAASRSAIEPDDLLTLIYTSGTTGPPKGVQLTHRNLMSAVKTFDEVIDFPEGARVVSYLPMAHIAERATGHYLPIVLGHSVTCCPNPREVIAYLPEVRPTWFFAVPRIWEKLKAGLEAMMEAEQDPERKRALSWAVEVGHRKVRLEQAGETVPEDLVAEWEKAEAQVLSKLRASLGLDELEAVYVGAAPTPLAVLEFFHAIGVPVAELWGLSESTGSGAVNLPGKIKLGSVGQVTPGMELKLADDGEILIRGPQIMKSYRNMDEATEAAFTPDGWLCTGDIGELDEEGYLRIVDRKKELIITAGGKNISPANLESLLKHHPLVGQAAVIGDRRPYVAALIVLDAEAAPAWAKANGVSYSDIASFSAEDRVRAEIQRAVDDANQHVSNVEAIKRFTILPTEWTVDSEELTPTLKLKRRVVTDKYATEIEALYSSS